MLFHFLNFVVHAFASGMCLLFEPTTGLALLPRYSKALRAPEYFIRREVRPLAHRVTLPCFQPAENESWARVSSVDFSEWLTDGVLLQMCQTQLPSNAAGSDGQRNTCLQFTRRSLEA